MNWRFGSLFCWLELGRATTTPREQKKTQRADTDRPGGTQQETKSGSGHGARLPPALGKSARQNTLTDFMQELQYDFLLLRTNDRIGSSIQPLTTSCDQQRCSKVNACAPVHRAVNRNLVSVAVEALLASAVGTRRRLRRDLCVAGPAAAAAVRPIARPGVPRPFRHFVARPRGTTSTARGRDVRGANGVVGA